MKKNKVLTIEEARAKGYSVRVYLESEDYSYETNGVRVDCLGECSGLKYITQKLSCSESWDNKKGKLYCSLKKEK